MVATFQRALTQPGLRDGGTLARLRGRSTARPILSDASRVRRPARLRSQNRRTPLGEFIKLPVGWMPCGVAVDDTHIYWGVYETTTPGNSPEAGTAIGRANKDGTAQVDTQWGGGNRVTGVAVHGDFVYRTR
jgi:hypothetical protein